MIIIFLHFQLQIIKKITKKFHKSLHDLHGFLMININAADKHNMNTCQYNHVIRQLKKRKI